MQTDIRRGLLGALFASGLLALGCTTAHASEPLQEAAAGPIDAATSGDHSIASGNQVIAPVTAPVTVGAVSAAVLGDSTAINKGGNHNGGDKWFAPGPRIDAVTSGDHSIASGNQVIVPVTAPVTVGAVSAAVLGDSTAINKGGNHNGGSYKDGNHNGSAAGPRIDAVTSGDHSIASGNQVIAPVTAPVTVGAVSAAVLGDSTAINEGGKPKDDGYNSGKPKDDGYNSGKPKDDGYNSGKLKDDGYNSGKPKDDGYNSGKPKDDGYNSGKPKDDGYNSGKPKDDGYNSGKPKDDGYNSGKPKDDGYNSGKPKDDGYNSGKPKDDGYNSGKPKDDGYNSGKPKDDGYNSGKPKDDGYKNDKPKDGNHKTPGAGPWINAVTSGDHSILSGNQVIVPVTAPVTVGAVSTAVLGDSTAINKDGGYKDGNPKGSAAGPRIDAVTSGDHSILSGNQVIAPVTAPVTVGAVSTAVLGDSTAINKGGGNHKESAAGPRIDAVTSGDHSILSGNQVIAPVTAPVTVRAVSAAVLGDSTAINKGGGNHKGSAAGPRIDAVTSGDHSILSGNQVIAPVTAPVTVGAVSAAVLGDSTAINKGGGNHKDGNYHGGD